MTKPYLVVRASIEPEVLEDFCRWYQEVHLPHVMAIPGVARAYRSNCRRTGINWTALYELEDNTAIQRAFASDEANQARQDWEHWLPHVSDLTVEVYAVLGPLPNYHHSN